MGAIGQGNARERCDLQSATDFVRALPDAGDWYLLHIKSRQDKLLADELHRMGIGHYVPLARQVRLYGKRKATVEIPLFPGYVFLRGCAEDTYQANRTHRVARIITVNDQSRLDWELRNLHLAQSNSVTLDPYPFLRKGIRAEVRSGPLRGLQGLIEDVLGSGRLVLQIDMHGRPSALKSPAPCSNRSDRVVGRMPAASLTR